MLFAAEGGLPINLDTVSIQLFIQPVQDRLVLPNVYIQAGCMEMLVANSNHLPSTG